MSAFERGLAEVFASLEAWLVASGAAASMLALSWAVLTLLWLGYVAASMQPGRPADVVAIFGRLLLAGGLLSAVGSLNAIIIHAFETLRDAGSAVLLGLVTQNWNELVLQWVLTPLQTLFQPQASWRGQYWALIVLVVAIVLGILLFAIGFMIYLAILFFAHLTLLLAIFLAPLALALLAAPGTARWTARWAAVVVRTGLVVFCVRVIHAAAIYLAVIVPMRQMSAGIQNGLGGLGGGGGGLGGDLQAAGVLVWHVASAVVLMIVGTGMGVYAMLRAERLIGQFVDGVAFGEGLFAWPLWAGGRLAGRGRSASGGAGRDSALAVNVPAAMEPFGAASGAAQEATVIMPGGRPRP